MLPALAFIFSSVFKELQLEAFAVALVPPSGRFRLLPAPWGELKHYRRITRASTSHTGNFHEMM
jgi:hypothetical protein